LAGVLAQRLGSDPAFMVPERGQIGALKRYFSDNRVLSVPEARNSAAIAQFNVGLQRVKM
jgi:hypothetical protein